jgi:hypothetical protein
VVLRVPSGVVVTKGASHTMSTSTVGSDTVYTFTAGSDTITIGY